MIITVTFLKWLKITSGSEILFKKPSIRAFQEKPHHPSVVSPRLLIMRINQDGEIQLLCGNSRRRVLPARVLQPVCHNTRLLLSPASELSFVGLGFLDMDLAI